MLFINKILHFNPTILRENKGALQSGLDLNYLRLLSQQYPSIRTASTEIINLSAILELPKGTEHFISDIHGEYEAFLHVLRNGSGSIKRKIEDAFKDTLQAGEKSALATLIYYPEKKLPLILKECTDSEEWFRITLFRLIKLCRVVSSKYTRSRVRKALPDDFAYIIEELLHEQESIRNRQDYYSSIIDTIIGTNRTEAFIIALANLMAVFQKPIKLKPGLRGIHSFITHTDCYWLLMNRLNRYKKRSVRSRIFAPRHAL